jgi:hypothetical protein
MEEIEPRCWIEGGNGTELTPEKLLHNTYTVYIFWAGDVYIRFAVGPGGTGDGLIASSAIQLGHPNSF